MWLACNFKTDKFAAQTPPPRMPKTFYLLIASLHFFTAATAQVPDSVKVFTDSALNLMQQHSVFSSKVNWKQVRDSVQLMTANARSYHDVHPALQYAFDKLGDKHGFLLLDGEVYKNADPRLAFDTTRLNDNMKLAASKGARIYAGQVQQQYAYISIPYFGGQSPVEAKQFAQTIQDSLCGYITPATKGIIIDLRINGGGNTYAMIAGLANVLGDGLFMTNVDASGKPSGEWKLQQGALNWYDPIPLKIDRSCGDFSKLPVALITGPMTASAGENIAIAFTGRKKAILIGENTGGYVTANDGRYLPGKKNGLVLAMEFNRDRNGKAYYDEVTPNIKVTGGDDFFNRDKDRKIQAAVKWLKTQR
jgi:carboxyl-terminal processing protease